MRHADAQTKYACVPLFWKQQTNFVCGFIRFAFLKRIKTWTNSNSNSQFAFAACAVLNEIQFQTKHKVISTVIAFQLTVRLIPLGAFLLTLASRCFGCTQFDDGWRDIAWKLTQKSKLEFSLVIWTSHEVDHQQNDIQMHDQPLMMTTATTTMSRHSFEGNTKNDEAKQTLSERQSVWAIADVCDCYWHDISTKSKYWNFDVVWNRRQRNGSPKRVLWNVSETPRPDATIKYDHKSAQISNFVWKISFRNAHRPSQWHFRFDGISFSLFFFGNDRKYLWPASPLCMWQRGRAATRHCHFAMFAHMALRARQRRRRRRWLEFGKNFKFAMIKPRDRVVPLWVKCTHNMTRTPSPVMSAFNCYGNFAKPTK